MDKPLQIIKQVEALSQGDKVIQLDQRQLKAVELILSGHSDEAVAKEVGVRRETVCRWRNNNFAFQAVLNKGRKELWDDATSKLRNLAHKAIETITKAIEDGDVKTSMDLLKNINMYGSIDAPKEATDPRVLLYEEAKTMADRAVENLPPGWRKEAHSKFMESYLHYLNQLDKESVLGDGDPDQVTDDHPNPQDNQVSEK